MPARRVAAPTCRVVGALEPGGVTPAGARSGKSVKAPMPRRGHGSVLEEVARSGLHKTQGIPMNTLDLVPMVRAPAAWPAPFVATIAMVALAGLDLVGAVAAKEWAQSRGLLPLAAGITTFVVLWWVYASSLQYAELAVVTMGWVVVLQVGLVLVDRFRYAVELPAAKWVAMVVALAAQAYLLLAPNGPGDAPA